MKPVDKRILDFISRHHVLTLAVSKDGQPYCAHCFYCYLKDQNRFVFTSDPETRHIRDFESAGNGRVAAGIALETRMVGKIRGLQLTGRMIIPGGSELQAARNAYLKRFPIARLAKLNLWAFDPEFMKLTDNRLGFGTKLVWEAT